MHITKRLIATLLCALLCAPAAPAQDRKAESQANHNIAQDVLIIIQQQQVRFTAQRAVEEMRLQIFNQAGEMIYDSSAVSGPELNWPLRNASGETVKSGLYAYTLSIKETGAEKPRERRGHFIVDRAGDRDTGADRLWITSQGENGVGTELTVARSEENTVAGAAITSERRIAEERDDARRDDERATETKNDKTKEQAKASAAAPTGTVGRIAKFTSATDLGDSVMIEQNGNIGIGTQTPDRQLTVQSNSGAYLNVKAGNGAHEVLLGADANGGIVSTMTNHDLQLRAGGNSTKMIIKADGKVGIGSTAPNAKLNVHNTTEPWGIFAHTTTNDSIGVFGQTLGTEGMGVLGRYDGPGSNSGGWGVFGFSPKGFAGVFGSGGNNGVYGHTASANHSGVYGRNESAGYGVHGYTVSGFAGVWGLGGQNGVFGQTYSADDRFSGVYGRNEGAGKGLTGSSLNGEGVLGETQNATRNGGYFRNLAGGGAVYGETQSVNEAYSAIWGRNKGNGWGVVGSSLIGHGILGETASRDRFGGVFRNTGGGTALRVEGTASVGALQITGGADFAENFDVSVVIVSDETTAPKIEAGMVVSIDPTNPGKLQLSRQAYDRRVAGVISGAGGVKTGMVMGQEGTLADGKHPVALGGRVYCWVDASYGAIKPGDLLTTSPTPGHAMKVSNRVRAQGAIIGKAMTGLKNGKGLVLVLVTLQ